MQENEQTRQLRELREENGQLRLELAKCQEAEAILRISEKQMRDVFEEMALIAVALDSAGRITYCNRMACEVTGWTREELIGSSWLEKMTPGQPETQALFQWLMGRQDNQPLPRHENPIVTRDGEQRWIRWSNTALHNDDGIIIGVVSLGEDLTAQRASDRALQESRAQIAQMNADLEQRIAARTCELAAANVMLQQLSVEDGLTRLTNRRRFGEVLDEEVRRAKRSGEPLSLLIADIDFFKGYNDHYGHLAGDQCLQAVSGAMRSLFRRGGEIVARYGGEEFAVILPGVAQLGAEQAGQRLREAIEALQIEHASVAAGHLTISVGCATVTQGIEISADDLIRLADGAMYDSKHWGRNRVSCRVAA